MKRENFNMPNWEETSRRLEAESKQRLPETDTDLAIQRFERGWKFLHQNRMPQTGSGLVEQQVLFRKLGRTSGLGIVHEGSD